jgi:hypothetical protein
MYSHTSSPTGPLIGEYARSGKGARRRILIWGILFGIGLAGLYVTTSQGLYNSGGSQPSPYVIATLVGLCAGILLWYDGYLGFIRSEQTFEVYQDGFTMRQKDNSSSYMWTDVHDYTHAVTRHYYNGVHTGDTRILTLRMNDGKKFVLNNTFKNVAQLQEILPQLTFGPLMQRTAEALQSGQSIQFGSMAVTPLGLYNGKETLPWSEIADLRVDKGMITIFARHPQGKRPRKFGSMNFGKLPNAFVFLQLVTKLSPALSGQPAPAAR